jgi:predicted permease
MDLLIGFTTILVVIAAGAALAHVGVLDRRSQRTLGEIAFFVASPALMVVTISTVHLETAAANLVTSSVSLATCFVAYVAIARLRWRLDTGSLLIGALSSSYVTRATSASPSPPTSSATSPSSCPPCSSRCCSCSPPR